MPNFDDKTGFVVKAEGFNLRPVASSPDAGATSAFGTIWLDSATHKLNIKDDLGVNRVLPLTAADDALAVHLAGAETVTGAKTFTNAGSPKINNSADTFAATLKSNATAPRTITLPDATGEPMLNLILSIPCVLKAHTTTSIAARFTPGFAGTITGISFSVTDPVTTGAKLGTFTPAIAAVSTTGGAVALTSANCTPVGAAVAGSAITAANTFTAAQEVTIVASAVTAFIEGQGVFYVTLTQT